MFVLQFRELLSQFVLNNLGLFEFVLHLLVPGLGHNIGLLVDGTKGPVLEVANALSELLFQFFNLLFILGVFLVDSLIGIHTAFKLF